MATVRYTVIDGAIVAEKRDGVRRAYVPDAIGSTVALLDNSQVQTDTFTYWPYGEEKSRTGSTPTPFGYVGTRGYYRESENRSFVATRHLQVSQGRWMQQDHIGYAGKDINLYRYASANPSSVIDPTGLQTIVDCPPRRNDPRPPYVEPPRRPHRPGSGHPWAGRYGNCCGPFVRGTCKGWNSPDSRGLDPIDQACCVHDCCIRTFIDWIIRGRSCDLDLCEVAQMLLEGGGCKKAPNPSNCEIVATQIRNLMCSLGTITFPFLSPDF